MAMLNHSSGINAMQYNACTIVTTIVPDMHVVNPEVHSICDTYTICIAYGRAN